MNVLMSDVEKALFLKTISEKGGVYFEFGSGGSTVAASGVDSIDEIISVESDSGWLDKVRTHLTKKNLLISVDIGPTKDWGTPTDRRHSHKWSAYSSAIDGHRPDVVLVDGRFRVACICKAILSLNENGIIVVHDFWNRTHYHVVLPFLDVVSRADTLAVFKVKSGVDKKKVLALWNEYKNVFK